MDSSTKNPASIHIIQGEIQNVVAAMRVNSRWASSSRLTSHPESPLLQGFKNLSAALHKVSDISELDTLAYLKPFLGVIRSEETSGPITGVALSSIHKFLSYGFIHESSPNASKAMAVITDIVTHCQFEATAPDSDEVVLATILDVLLACLICPAGFLLTDESVQEMIQTCFRMSIQKRLSELLRKRAERTLLEMVHTVFLNGVSYSLQSPSQITSEATSTSTAEAESLIPNNLSTKEEIEGIKLEGEQTVEEVENINECAAVKSDGGDRAENKEKGEQTKGETASKEDKGDHVNSRGIRFQNRETAIPNQKPYGIGCIIKTFTFLCGLTLPSRANPEGVRHLALSLINTILETLPHPVKQMGTYPAFMNALLPTIQNELCHHLLLNLNADDLAIFTLTLRVFYNLFVSLKDTLKTQVEAFFQCLLNNVMDSKTVSYEKQEMALECIVEFCSTSNFMVDLYVNYDCDLYCSNLFESMCKFLYKNAFPVSGSLYTIHILSLDGLLAVVNSIAQRCHSQDISVKPPIPSEELVKRKQLKRVLTMAAEHWNRSYKEGLKFMQDMSLLPTPLDGRSVAMFFKNTPGLDKEKVGEYLGKDDPLVAEVLREYVHSFDFTNVSFVFALRSFLEMFMLPKEAQQISRILESYALRYFTCNSDWVKSSEACYVLAFATVLLNVDLHSPKVAEKMRPEQFVTNLRGLNGDEDFPEAMLLDIYKSIDEREFKLLEDYTGGKMTQVKWNSVLRKGDKCAPFIATSSNAYDKDIFSIILGCPIIAAISVVFDTATDDAILQKALGGFNLCAQISAYYVLSDVFDNLVISLCSKSTLLSPPGDDPIVTFGRNRKAQMATSAVFMLTREHSNHFREAWKYILDCVLSLHNLELLPSLTDLHLQAAGEGNTELVSPSISRRKAPQPAPQSFIQSLLSTIALSDNNEAEPSQEEVLAIQQTRNTIDSADIKSIFINTPNLQADSLLYLLKALILADRSVRPKGTNSYPFDEDMSRLCLDLITAITILNKERVILLWVLVYEHFSGIIGPATVTSVLVERAVSNLLLLSYKLLYTDIADQLLRSLSLLLKLNSTVAASLSGPIVAGVVRLLQADPSLIGSPAAWPTVLPLIRFATGNTATATMAFRAFSPLLAGETTLVFLDNFFEVFHTVRAFAVSRKCNSKMAIEALECMYSLFSRLPRLLEAPQEGSTPLAVEHSDPVDDLGFALIPADTSSPVSGEKEDPSSLSVDCEPEWTKYWQPILAAFAGLCQDGRLDVRHHAMTYLQRALLSPPLARLRPLTWVACFELVIFPLLNSLLAPRPRDPTEAAGLEETRFRASALLSKIFLQYMAKIIAIPDFEDLWFKVLQFIELYMKADNSELLAEAVPESLKNILLVMSASGVLVEPGEGRDGSAARLWETSWARIGQFCPLLKEEFNTVLAKSGPPALEEVLGKSATVQEDLIKEEPQPNNNTKGA